MKIKIKTTNKQNSDLLSRTHTCQYWFWTNIKTNIFPFIVITEANFPRFAEPIPNITVTIGRDALLACVVDNLKGFRVSIEFHLFPTRLDREATKWLTWKPHSISCLCVSVCAMLKMTQKTSQWKWVYNNEEIIPN